MRKPLAIAAAAALGFSLTACGGSAEETTTVVIPTPDVTTTTVPTPTPDDTALALPPDTFSVSAYQAARDANPDSRFDWTDVASDGSGTYAVVFTGERVAQGGESGWTQTSPDWPLSDLNAIMNGEPAPAGFEVTTTEQGVPLVLFTGEGYTCTNDCTTWEAHMAALLPDPSLTGGEHILIGYWTETREGWVNAPEITAEEFADAARAVEIVP